MKIDAILILSRFAADRVASCPIEEQIKIYQAISEAIPDRVASANARELARTLSRTAALQMDFSQQLFEQEKASAQDN